MELKEFQKRVAYQIYPSSFKDSNNDGWGDLKGIISKLDYLKDLGIGLIWLSPIYVSPLKDMGYDIADYKKINPLFGTMDDFDQLIKKANELDIKVVMDLVINHTSTEHEWFKKAVSDPNSPYRNYYIIQKGSKTKAPNNWDSMFSGKAWKKFPNSDDEYYLHLFCDDQADLNYHNHQVVEEIKDIIKFWLDKGVYGFRCDVINCLYKSTLKNDSPFKILEKGSKYYFNQDGFFKVMKEIREDVLDKYDTFLLGETSHIDVKMGERFIKERALDTFFEFDHIYCDKHKLIPIFKKKFSSKYLMKQIAKWQNSNVWMANYLENHDQLRSISRYGSKKYFFESGSLLATLLLTLRGTPFIYQGEEIGTLNDENITLENTNDVCVHMAYQKAKKALPFSDQKIIKMINETINRDHARKPMMFDDSINGGFNEGQKPWLDVNNQYKENNVLKQQNDPHSLLNYYKKLIKFRKDNDILVEGDIKFEYITNKINSYYRLKDGKVYLVLLNFSNKKAKYQTVLKLKRVLANYEEEMSFDNIKPYYAAIYEVLKEGE